MESYVYQRYLLRVNSGTVDPLITVETCGVKKYSASKSGIACGSAAMAHWKEHLFFEPRNIVSEALDWVTDWLNGEALEQN